MKQLLNKLVAKNSLTDDEMIEFLDNVVNEKISIVQRAALLTAYTTKGEVSSELASAARYMQSHATSFDLPPHPHRIDIVGTGGDHAHLFNVSTTSMFVAAAVGAQVVKHGSRAATSRSGSADVLSEAGVMIDAPIEKIKETIQTVHTGFLFAPHFNPYFKKVHALRQELGIRTIFNILGPLINPAKPKRIFVGVSSLHLQALFAESLDQLGYEHALIVHSEDGLDEISSAASTHVMELKNHHVSTYMIHPEDYEVKLERLDQQVVRDPKESLAILKRVLQNENIPGRSIVLLNAGAAIYVAGLASSIREGILCATEAIKSGTAYKKFEELIHHAKAS